MAVARDNAARLGPAVIRDRGTRAPRRRVRPRARQPALRARGRVGRPRAGDHPLRAARGARLGTDGLDAIRELVRSRGAGTRLALEHAPGQAAAVRGLLARAADPPRPRRARARDRGNGAVNAEDVETFRRCIAVGGVALFPADTVYGLATEPHSREGVDRIYGLKGRRAERPAAVMFFGLELALAALPEIGERPPARSAGCSRAGHRRAAQPRSALPARLRSGARAPRPAGARALEGELAPLRDASWPVLQSSANPSGAPRPARVAAVDPRIRRGVDMNLDGGELPGTRRRSSRSWTTSTTGLRGAARGGRRRVK